MKAVFLALVATALIAGGVYIMMKPTQNVQFSVELIEDFQQWKSDHGKSYGDVDYEVYRMNVFNENQQMIIAHNQSGDSYLMGENQFMDLTNEEFQQIYLTLKQKDTQSQFVHEDNGVNAGSVNWVTAGAVTPIKNQGQCGSCWAFSTTGGLEGVSFIWGKNLQSFSEQQLVDCSTSYGNNGCNGGLMDYAFKYVIANGICTEAQYPYKAVDGTCKIKQLCTSPAPQTIIKSYTDVPKGKCDSLTNAINTQPISIGVDASNWQFYKSGVFKNCQKQLDHGVLAVGYTPTYWLVKNSWGTSWGMQGYIQLALGNTCGICNTASYGNYA